MDAFKGKYERTSADNYEELLKEGLQQMVYQDGYYLSLIFRNWMWTSCWGKQPLCPPQWWRCPRRAESGTSRPPPHSRQWNSSLRYCHSPNQPQLNLNTSWNWQHNTYDTHCCCCAAGQLNKCLVDWPNAWSTDQMLIWTNQILTQQKSSVFNI